MKKIIPLFMLVTCVSGAGARASNDIRRLQSVDEQTVSAALTLYRTFPAQIKNAVQKNFKDLACRGIQMLSDAQKICLDRPDAVQLEDTWMYRNFTMESSVEAMGTLVSYCDPNASVEVTEVIKALEKLSIDKMYESNMPTPEGIN